MADADKKEFNISVERLYKHHTDTKRQFERIDAEFNGVKNNINSRATIKDFNQLKGEMGHLATK
jgi:hypothetical protein